MKRDQIFGIDPEKNWVFVFLYENDDKELSLIVEYSNDEQLKLLQQDLILYSMVWSTQFATVEEVINLFEINFGKKLGLKSWYEKPKYI